MIEDKDTPVTKEQLDKSLIDVYGFILDQEADKDEIIRILMDNITELSRTISVLVRHVL